MDLEILNIDFNNNGKEIIFDSDKKKKRKIW